MQNVHVMRPDVRAEYERLGRPLDGDDAFHTRLERFFTELRDPLRAVYALRWAFSRVSGAAPSIVAAATSSPWVSATNTATGPEACSTTWSTIA